MSELETDEGLLIFNYKRNPANLEFKPTIIGWYEMDKGKGYIGEGGRSPKLTLPEPLTGLKLDIGRPDDEAKGNERPADADDLSHEAFLKWLSEEFDHNDKDITTKVDFVCLSDRIADMLVTPCLTRGGKWTVFGTKLNDSVYLWDHSKSSGSRRSALSANQERRVRQLLTDIDSNDQPTVFVVERIEFGRHRLLCAKSVAATDDNVQLFDIRSHKTSPGERRIARDKQTKYWALNVVPGMKAMVVCKASGSGYLQSVDIVDVAKYRPNIFNYCLEFTDNLLHWMRNHFRDEPEGVTKMFQLRPRDKRIRCKVVDKEDTSLPILPKWFVESFDKN